MKKISLLILTMVFATGLAIGQKTVSGVVTDTGGEALIGANVYVPTSTEGTVTDIDGSFSLDVPEGTDVIKVSYTGFQTKTVDISSGSNFDIVLSEGELLDEVVVTALGVEVDQDKQGSASSSINSELVNNSSESGALQALTGKTSSLVVNRSSGDPGAGGYLQIRGQNTITGSTQPLIVIDGMPMFNSSIGSGVAGVVQQSRMNDINPDDIASIDVLKGAAAAALWGSRAANGVIVIRTKKGIGGQAKKFDINFKSTYSIDRVNVEHPLQNIYGQGRGGRYEAGRGESWGDKISERPGGDNFYINEKGKYFDSRGRDLYAGYLETEDGKKIYRIYNGGATVHDKDGKVIREATNWGGKNSKQDFTGSNRDQIFRDGSYIENSLSIGGASGGANYFLSYSNLGQKGIMKGNSDYHRNTFRINASNRFTDYLKIGINLAYSNISSNRIQTGSNLAGLYLGYLRTSPDFDNSIYTGTYYNTAGIPTKNVQRGYRNALGSSSPAYNNPGWTLNRQVNTSTVDRYMITPEINITPLSWLEVTGRVGIDNYTDDRLTYFPLFSAGTGSSGRTIDNIIAEKQLNADLFARMSRNISDDISASLTLGYNYNDRKYKSLDGEISNFVIPNAPIGSLGNATAQNATPDKFISHRRSNAGYAELRFDMFEKLFVTLTGRREVASTYTGGIFYPSASVAYNLVDDSKGVLSFAKLRASYGSVGIEPPVYVSTTDFVAPETSESWGPNLNGGQYGGGYNRSLTRGNPDLVPEKKNELEFGADLRFFDNKLKLSASYYQNRTKGAIFAVDVPASTGFSRQWKNAATIENKGIEVDLGYSVFQTNDFNWDVFMNFSRNRNLVADLAGVKSIFLNGFAGSSSRAVEGHPLGTLWGGRFTRDESGKLVLDENGFPTQALEEGVIGDPNPDWRGGLGSSISFKGLNFSFLFETSQGQDMWAGTKGVLNHFGKHPETAVETVAATDLKTYGGRTIKAGETFRGSVKNFGGGDVALEQGWYTSLGGGFGPVGEQFVSDASWTRLREVGLSYRFNKPAFLKNTFDFIELGFIGRNLWLNTKFEGQDPESNLTGASNGRGLDYFSNPGTKSFVFTLKLNY